MNVLRLQDYTRALKLRYGNKVESIRIKSQGGKKYFQGDTARRDTLGRRGGKPATILRTGKTVKLMWMVNGVPYREDDLPTSILFCEQGVYHFWCISIAGAPAYHRANGPAFIWRRGGQKLLRWYDRGDIHREGNPAHLYFHNDKLICAKWYFRGKIHNIGAPAVVVYGQRILEEWWENGVLLRRKYRGKNNEADHIFPFETLTNT